jgi:hypothetical protein
MVKTVRDKKNRTCAVRLENSYFPNARFRNFQPLFSGSYESVGIGVLHTATRPE